MEFCMSVAAKLMKKEIEKGSSNVVLSPLSITLLLNLLALGSSGETLAQFLRLLGSQDTDDLNSKSQAIMSLLHRNDAGDDQDPIFALSSAVWVDQSFPLKPSFEAIADSTYRALVKNVDLVSKGDHLVAEVNSWAESETKGLIKNVLPPGANLGPPLCLANAVYFKGAWEYPFEAVNTRKKDFHSLNGKVITKVPFMTMANKYHSYGSFEDFKLLKMPYEHGSGHKKFSMCVFLPHEKDGLKGLVDKLNDSDSAKLLLSECFSLTNRKLSKVLIPKMRFSHGFDAIEVLKEKGLTLPFDENSADFTSMVDCANENVYVGMFIHKARVEVNEKGTEAAAVSLGGMMMGCAPGPRIPLPSFVADHPFMFTIVEDSSKLVVFTGVVLNPLLR